LHSSGRRNRLPHQAKPPAPPGETFIRILSSILLCSAGAWAATYQVTPADGARAVQAAVDKAAAGDTVLIHAGVYREAVRVTQSGTAQKPIVIAGAPGEEAILAGADVIPSNQWTAVEGTSVWKHTPWTYKGRTHPNDERHRLIGRTEQVIVDGKLLRQVLEMDQLEPGTFLAEPATALYVRMPAPRSGP
jgi:hypothetical protein